MNRRRTSRVVVYGSAFLTAGRIGGGATLFNLSEGGCALEISRSVTPGERFAVHLMLSEEEPPIFIEEAKVCWAAGDRIGLEFLAMSELTRAQLRECVRIRLSG